MANKPGLRFDSAHAGIPAPASAAVGAADNTSARVDEQSEPRSRRRKQPRRPHIADTPPANAPTANAPTTGSSHDDLVRTAIEQPGARRTNWTATAGQLCAYGGVGLLTCGTVLVLSGHFGGPASYAPSGWLIAAVGQMLLFLGVVTLVSGGMEQTVDEVAWRMDHLAERIVHLEHLLEERDARERRARREQMRLRAEDQSARDQADAA